MKRNTGLQEKVKEAMNSLDAIDKAEPAPFFYTRVLARLMNQRKNFWESLSRTVTRPAVAIMSLGLIILVNGFIALDLYTKTYVPERSEVAVADEYNRTNSFYDLEN